MLIGMLVGASFAAEVLVVMQNGGDGSVLEERKVETAVEMRTVSAPSVAGQIFVGWSSSSEQAFVARDRHGRALEVARQVIYGETTLTANYLDETVDSDGDGVPDGWELYWYGDLDETATSDTDGDGYDFAAELAAGTDPLMPDRGVSGGIVWADGGVLQYNPDGLPRYRVRSEPEGELFETYEEFVSPGTRVQIATQTGGTFAYWTTNGVRVADRHGRARDSVTFVMRLEPVDIVAVCESDELRRQQLYWYGTTVDPASDTDGDGYTFAEEMAAGTDPLMPDRGVLGGIVWADGTRILYNPDGLHACVIRSEPESVLFATVSNVVKKGARVTTEGLLPSDSDFAYWTLNGVRVADRHGRAKDDVSVAMGDDPLEIVAVCETNALLRQQLYWYGTSVDPASDTDGDGYSFAEEMAAGTDPLMPDRAVLGGIVWADSAVEMVNLQIYEQVQGALVDGEYEELFFSPYAKNAATSRTFADGAQIWPVVADVNGDGLWDLIVVSATTTNVFANVGTKGNPQFANCGSGLAVSVDLQMNSTDKLAAMELDVEPVGALSATTNGLTLLVSDDEGRIWYYKKNAEASSFTYQLLHKVWGGSFAGFAQGLMLAAVDWEDDGDLDCICATAEGKLMLLRDPNVGRPTNLKADAGVDNVLLTWDPNAQSRVRGYKVYRGGEVKVEGQGQQWNLINSIQLPTYRDTGLEPSIYSYKVSALSRFYTAGNSTPTEYESESTEPVVTRVGGPTIVVGEPKRTVDGTVEIAVSINNSMNYNAEGTSITIPYVDENLAYQATKPSGLSEKLNYKAVAADGKVVIEIESGEVMPGAGVFFTIVFKGLLNGVLMGDLDGNGKVDRDDLKLLAKLKSAAGRKYTDYQLKAGDFNQNGKLDNADYQMLRDLLKNKGEL